MSRIDKYTMPYVKINNGTTTMSDLDKATQIDTIRKLFGDYNVYTESMSGRIVLNCKMEGCDDFSLSVVPMKITQNGKDIIFVKYVCSSTKNTKNGWKQKILNYNNSDYKIYWYLDNEYVNTYNYEKQRIKELITAPQVNKNYIKNYIGSRSNYDSQSELNGAELRGVLMYTYTQQANGLNKTKEYHSPLMCPFYGYEYWSDEDNYFLYFINSKDINLNNLKDTTNIIKIKDLSGKEVYDFYKLYQRTNNLKLYCDVYDTLYKEISSCTNSVYGIISDGNNCSVFLVNINTLSNVINDPFFSYDENTNKISFYFYDNTAYESTEGLLHVTEVTPFSDTNKYDTLKQDLTIDLARVNSGEFYLDSYRYYMTESLFKIEFQQAFYNKEGQSIDKSYIEFYDVTTNSSIFYNWHSNWNDNICTPTLTGSFGTEVATNNNDDFQLNNDLNWITPLRKNELASTWKYRIANNTKDLKLEKDKFYCVLFSVHAQEDINGTIGNDLTITIRQSDGQKNDFRFLYTTELFNCYWDGTKTNDDGTLVKDFKDAKFYCEEEGVIEVNPEYHIENPDFVLKDNSNIKDISSIKDDILFNLTNYWQTGNCELLSYIKLVNNNYYQFLNHISKDRFYVLEEDNMYYNSIFTDNDILYTNKLLLPNNWLTYYNTGYNYLILNIHNILNQSNIANYYTLDYKKDVPTITFGRATELTSQYMSSVYFIEPIVDFNKSAQLIINEKIINGIDDDNNTKLLSLQWVFESKLFTIDSAFMWNDFDNYISYVNSVPYIANGTGIIALTPKSGNDTTSLYKTRNALCSQIPQSKTLKSLSFFNESTVKGEFTGDDNGNLTSCKNRIDFSYDSGNEHDAHTPFDFYENVKLNYYRSSDEYTPFLIYSKAFKRTPNNLISPNEVYDGTYSSKDIQKNEPDPMADVKEFMQLQIKGKDGNEYKYFTINGLISRAYDVGSGVGSGETRLNNLFFNDILLKTVLKFFNYIHVAKYYQEKILDTQYFVSGNLFTKASVYANVHMDPSCLLNYNLDSITLLKNNNVRGFVTTKHKNEYGFWKLNPFYIDLSNSINKTKICQSDKISFIFDNIYILLNNKQCEISKKNIPQIDDLFEFNINNKVSINYNIYKKSEDLNVTKDLKEHFGNSIRVFYLNKKTNTLHTKLCDGNYFEIWRPYIDADYNKDEIKYFIDLPDTIKDHHDNLDWLINNGDNKKSSMIKLNLDDDNTNMIIPGFIVKDQSATSGWLYPLKIEKIKIPISKLYPSISEDQKNIYYCRIKSATTFELRLGEGWKTKHRPMMARDPAIHLLLSGTPSRMTYFNILHG